MPLAFPFTQDKDLARILSEIQRADDENYKKNRNVVIPIDRRLILQSPGGTYWEIHVSDAGVLTTASTTHP
jgi:hypothetical protein